jgi:hypothetical protein
MMSSDKIIGPYKLLTNDTLPDLEHGDNQQAEDEVLWYSGGYYHIVWNYWNVQRAYHIMSKDGINNWTSTGAAYQGTQSPTNSYSNWLRYTDGTVNHWHNMERPGVYLENGHPAAFTFAVTDTDKNTSAVNSGGSKIIVVPFGGVQFDCDNGDSASCAELTKDGGAGGETGQGGSSASTASGGASGGGSGGGGMAGPGGAATDAGPGGKGGTSSGAGGLATGGTSGGGGVEGGSGGAGAAGVGGGASSVGGTGDGGRGGMGGGSGGAGVAGVGGGASSVAASGGNATEGSTRGSGGSSAGNGGRRGSGGAATTSTTTTNHASGCSCTIQDRVSASNRKGRWGLLFGVVVVLALRGVTCAVTKRRSTPDC